MEMAMTLHAISSRLLVVWKCVIGRTNRVESYLHLYLYVHVRFILYIIMCVYLKTYIHKYTATIVDRPNKSRRRPSSSSSSSISLFLYQMRHVYTLRATLFALFAICPSPIPCLSLTCFLARLLLSTIG